MLKNANSWLGPRANLSLCCWQNSIWQPANQVHKYILWTKRQQFWIWWFISAFIDLAVSLFFNVLVQNIYFVLLSGCCQQKYPVLSFLGSHLRTSLLLMCSFLLWVSNSTNPKWTPKICLKMHCFTIRRKLDQPTDWIHNCQITHVTKHQFNNPARMLKVAILTWKEVHPPKKSAPPFPLWSWWGTQAYMVSLFLVSSIRGNDDRNRLVMLRGWMEWIDGGGGD